MVFVQSVVDVRAGVLRRLHSHQLFGLLPIEEKAHRHQEEDAKPENEAALPLQAGLSEQMLETAIRHGR